MDDVNFNHDVLCDIGQLGNVRAVDVLELRRFEPVQVKDGRLGNFNGGARGRVIDDRRPAEPADYLTHSCASVRNYNGLRLRLALEVVMQRGGCGQFVN